MTPSQRKQLLEYVSSGLDVEAGAAQLGLSMSAVRKVGAKLARQLDEAYATGSARLRGRLLKAALTDNDLKVIQSLLEQRAISSAEGSSRPAARARFDMSSSVKRAECPSFIW